MPGTRPARQPRLSDQRSGTSSSSVNRRAPLREPTDTLLNDLRQRTNRAGPAFPSSPASVYGPSGSATHADLATPIDHAFRQHQHQQQQQHVARSGQSTSHAQATKHGQFTAQQPQVPLNSFQSPTYFDRMEYQERERMMQAAKILGSRELLMRYSLLHNESIPQTRLRLQKQLVGVKHVPYPPPSEAGPSTTTSKASKTDEARVVRDMRPEEDDETGTWADGEVVVGPGPLVQSPPLP